MDKIARLREALKNLIPQPTVLIAAEVISVEGDTCTVKFNDDLKVDGIRLRPTGSKIETKLLVTPRVGSFVLIGLQSNDFRDGNVIAVEESDKIEIISEKLNFLIDIPGGKITINNGELGGLVNIRELKENLDSLKQYVEAIHSALPSAFSAVGASTAANGGLGAQSYNGAMAGKTITIKDMEDPNVTH